MNPVVNWLSISSSSLLLVVCDVLKAISSSLFGVQLFILLVSVDFRCRWWSVGLSGSSRCLCCSSSPLRFVKCSSCVISFCCHIGLWCSSSVGVRLQLCLHCPRSSMESVYSVVVRSPAVLVTGVMSQPSLSGSCCVSRPTLSGSGGIAFNLLLSYDSVVSFCSRNPLRSRLLGGGLGG
jgi:hypothetical protein